MHWNRKRSPFLLRCPSTALYWQNLISWWFIQGFSIIQQGGKEWIWSWGAVGNLHRSKEWKISSLLECIYGNSIAFLFVFVCLVLIRRHLLWVLMYSGASVYRILQRVRTSELFAAHLFSMKIVLGLHYTLSPFISNKYRMHSQSYFPNEENIVYASQINFYSLRANQEHN